MIHAHILQFYGYWVISNRNNLDARKDTSRVVVTYALVDGAVTGYYYSRHGDVQPELLARMVSKPQTLAQCLEQVAIGPGWVRGRTATIIRATLMQDNSAWKGW